MVFAGMIVSLVGAYIQVRQEIPSASDILIFAAILSFMSLALVAAQWHPIIEFLTRTRVFRPYCDVYHVSGDGRACNIDCLRMQRN